MIRIKPGVSIRGIRPEIVLGITVVHSYLDSLGLDLTITEGTGGNHSPGSLHYLGLAVDLRSKDYSHDQIVIIVTMIKQILGFEFDVVLEVDHIHVEFQPKGPITF